MSQKNCQRSGRHPLDRRGVCQCGWPQSLELLQQLRRQAADRAKVEIIRKTHSLVASNRLGVLRLSHDIVPVQRVNRKLPPRFRRHVVEIDSEPLHIAKISVG